MQLNAAAHAVFASNASAYSLYELMAPFCSTTPGRTRLREWLESACVDAATLRQRHDVVAQLVARVAEHKANSISVELTVAAQALSHMQSHQSTLHALLTRSRSAEKGDQTSLEAFTELRAWILQLELLLRSEERADTTPLDRSFLIPLSELCTDKLSAFCDKIHDRTQSRAGDKADDADESDLHDLKHQVSQCEAEIHEHAAQTASKLYLRRDRVKVIYNTNDLFGRRMPAVVFRVSRQDFHRVQQQNQVALTLLRSSKSLGVWFSTPSLEIMSASWSTLQKRLRERERELVNELIQVFQRDFIQFVDRILTLLAKLDVLLAFARLAYERNLVRATIYNASQDNLWTIRLLSVFDPFITSNSKGQDKKVHVDVVLDRQSGKTLLVLAGDLNSGHRPLYLIGVIALMNQVGGFVPCGSAELPLFDAILVRAGAFDQQFHGQSTFKTEMLEINEIFTQMTSKSLVLIDDLCRGTSSVEGLALGVALCYHLMESSIPACVASQWRDLTDQLLNFPAATIILRKDDEVEMEGDVNRLLTEAMEEHSFPMELVERIRLELQTQKPSADLKEKKLCVDH